MFPNVRMSISQSLEFWDGKVTESIPGTLNGFEKVEHLPLVID